MASADGSMIAACSGHLCWWPELGRGYFPVTGSPYDADYFAKYQGYADQPIGLLLNQARVNMVTRHWHGQVIDVGIGCGQFVGFHHDATGFDVNPAGIAWLEAHNKFQNLYAERVDAACFWDSLEHIEDMDRAVQQVRRWLFVSLPIFDGPEHVLRSKHYRKDEHYHYFTREGFVAYMAAQGFELREVSTIETSIGREGIESFAFERMP